MNNNNYKILLDEYDFMSKSLNNIFKVSDNNIKNLLTKNGIKTRNNKIKFSDVLLYKFLYAYKNDSKQLIISTLNYNNDIVINRTTYHKKDLIIPSSFYKDLFYKIRDLYNTYIKSNDKYNLIAVDGTYNNTNINNIKGKLETSLNMGYYSINECLPIDITFCNQENKNKEILQLKKYINNNNLNNYKNVVIVADRAYYSYELVNFLNEHNFNYVIRIKNNSLSISNKEHIKKKITNYTNIRIITYEDNIDIIKKDKNNKDVKLKQTITCNIITNLNINDYGDNDIKKIYLSRWNIEVFFKLLKSNFKFSNLKEHHKNNTSNEYEKLYYSILIIIYISTMIDKINEKYNKSVKIKKNKSKNNYNIKTNKSVLINGIKMILSDIIKGIINKEILLKISQSFLLKMNIIKDVYNERISKTPHSKWYVQYYASYYRYITLLEALKTNNTDNLNKNLKLLFKSLKIIDG